MERRRENRGTGFYQTYRRYFRCIFLCRKNTAVTRFGSLRELDLDHLYIRPGRIRFVRVIAEISVLAARSKVSGAYLPNHISTRLQVVRAQATLTCVVSESTF